MRTFDRLPRRVAMSHRNLPCWMAAFFAAIFITGASAMIGAGAARAEESRLGVILKRDKLIGAVTNTSVPGGLLDAHGNLPGVAIECESPITRWNLGSRQQQ